MRLIIRLRHPYFVLLLAFHKQVLTPEGQVRTGGLCLVAGTRHLAAAGFPMECRPGLEGSAGAERCTHTVVNLFTIKQKLSSCCIFKSRNPQKFLNSRISYPEQKFMFFVLGQEIGGKMYHIHLITLITVKPPIFTSLYWLLQATRIQAQC